MRSSSGRAGAGKFMGAYVAQERALHGKGKLHPMAIGAFVDNPPAASSTGVGGSHKRMQANRRNCKRWTAEEEGTLKSLIEEVGENAWETVAAHMTDRTASGCEQHWAVMQGTHRSCAQMTETGKPRYQAPPWKRVKMEEEEEEERGGVAPVAAAESAGLEAAEYLEPHCVALVQDAPIAAGRPVHETSLVEAEELD